MVYYISNYLDNWLKCYFPIPGMYEIVAELKEKGWPLYILSDFPLCFDALKSRFSELFNLFTGLAISHECQATKGDKGLFAYLQKKFSLDARECLFIDDVPRLVENARWKHIGEQGSVYFPAEWLDASPRTFYGAKVYTAGLCFEYAIKTKVSMLHPTWQPREKDRAATEQMQKMLQELGITEEDIYPWIWSYNPYWYKQGYDEFFRPTIAYPITPK